MTVVFFCKNFTLISELSHLEGIEEKAPECYTEYRIKCAVQCGKSYY